jgi:hypothetical protein
MNWKAFTAVCISITIISFPQNIIGCGPDADPFDYYTSFFHQNLPDAKGYRPFYYVGYRSFYDDAEPTEVADVLAEEWAAYCGSSVKKLDAKKLVNKFAWKDLNNLYYNLEKNQPLKIPDTVKQNSMTAYFMQSKDLEALGYILYAKQVEPYVIGGESDWNAPERDSLKMAKLAKNGQQLYAVAKKDIFKLKYAYQFLRLGLYSGRNTDVINWYDEYAAKTTSSSVLQPLSLALKAGALFHNGQQKEAAYLFSKVFAASDAKRISNYLGFTWSVDSKADKKNYLDLCKNDNERAAMLSLFTLSSGDNNLADLKEIYRLNPASEELEVLAVREINKLEENYLTSAMLKVPGGKPFYFTWTDNAKDSVMRESEKEVKELATFLDNVAKSNLVKNAGLFETAAGYAAYMIRDYTTAKNYLAAAEKMPLTQKVKDQWTLTNLLVTINEKEKIDATFEEQLLPSLQWIAERVKTEKAVTLNYWQIQQWRSIYRNLMSEILAKRYHAQGDLAKETLCIGAADHMMKGEQDYYGSMNGIEFLRNNLMSKDVERLYTLVDSKQPNKFESYLLTNNSVTKKEVVDFAGTSYLREYDYAKAIDWFKKSANKQGINKSPFADLLYDREEQLASEKKFSITKLAFAKEMLKLEQTAKQPITAANSYYKLALGMYNISYYGHTWELVQYYRSGSDGYFIPENATGFQKEYYGVYKAHDYFEKAMKASTDKNFKARCLFMMAKCTQKLVHQPQYSEYSSGNWDKYDEAQKAYWPKFINNKYFPQFVKEYGSTAFYKEAFNSCSYLRDFVKKK